MINNNSHTTQEQQQLGENRIHRRPDDHHLSDALPVND
jgi:hypothetical protein